MVALLLNFIFMILMVMMGVAFLTLYERKILSYMQNRKGPNKLSLKGIMQPFSDMIKLISKEIIYMNSSKMFYYSPLFMFVLSSTFWINYPWIYNNLNMNYSMIFMLFVMSMNVYPVLTISWFSMNNYSILSMMRSVSQMISFEVLIYLIMLIFMMMTESFSLMSIIKYQSNIWFSISMYPIYFMFMLSMLIDLNRVPFDLIEGESELVSGFNLEYGSTLFTMIFLSEYMSLMFVSSISSVMFFGVKPWSPEFFLINSFNLNMLVMIRGVLSRIRYDLLMYMCWTELLILMLYYTIYVYLIKEIIMVISS